MTMTVTEMIGDEYEDWIVGTAIMDSSKVELFGSIVFITAPTGSGKTYFILHTLLPFCHKNNKKILYLVNRKILKEQIEEEIICSVPEYSDTIHVELYQNIEKRIQSLKWDTEVWKFQKMETPYATRYNNYECKNMSGPILDRSQDLSYFAGDYIVCDECHYFLADANYNTNTDLSLRWIFNYCSTKAKIFMSATINDVKNYITEEKKKENALRTKIYGFPSAIPSYEKLQDRDILLYPKNDQRRDYNYIDINIIKRNEIADKIFDENSKWLIFVDNISFAKKLKKEIETCFKNKQSGDISKRVVIITSDYKQNEESLAEVNMIIDNDKFSAEIIISTSVMDNGITIKDMELRNIVLMADTEVQFIQMLGRKRVDGTRFNLYIVQQTKDHFVRRKRNAIRILKVAQKYMNPFRSWGEGWVKELDHSHVLFESMETQLYIQQHRWLINELIEHKIQWEDVCNLFRVCDGTFQLNLLSYQNIKLQCQYYHKILKEIEKEGEDAFVKEQLKWLGKTDEEAEKLIKESKLSRKEICYKIVSERFEELFSDKEKMNADGSVTKSTSDAANWKHKIRKEFIVLVESTVYEKDDEKEKVDFDSAKNKMIGTIKKSTNYITGPNMEFLRIYCGLPYTVTVKGKTWTIYKYEEKKAEHILPEQPAVISQ